MLLTVRAAAERAGVSASLIYALCREGRLSHVRLGRGGRQGTIRIKDADLDAFMEQCTVEPPDGPDVEAYRRHLR